MYVCFRTATSLMSLVLLSVSMVYAAPLTFSGAGADIASIQTVFDDFVTELGGANNGTTAGVQGSGFRRITWDGGGAAAPATTFTVPMTAFSNRGNVYTTPGTGFEISGQPSPEFGEINVNYPGSFQPFSGTRLFAATGSNVMDVLMTIPGSTTVPSTTRGFGIVFTDVDLADTTSMSFYGLGDTLLGTYYAPVADNGLSFLGVTFDSSVIARVRVTSGNTALGVDETAGIDVVAMDDFVFAEPAAVPEPATTALVGLGLGAAGLFRRWRKARS